MTRSTAATAGQLDLIHYRSLRGAAGEWFDTTGWLELPRG